MSNLSAIVATDNNFLIGKNNTMPWYLPADLKHFKQITTGYCIIMGRKTFESLPKGALPNRRNIILSRNTFLKFPNAEIFSSVDELLQAVAKEQEVFIIGGAEIYSLLIPLVSKIYITRIKHSFEGDTYFPHLDFDKWEMIDEQKHLADQKNKWDYNFETYVKK